MPSRMLKKSDIGLAIIVGLALIIIVAAFLLKGPFAVQLRAVFRFLVWILASIYVSAPIFTLGHWVAQRILHCYPHESPTCSMLIAWTMGWAVVIILGMILLGFGIYSIWVWLVLALSLNIITVFWLFRRRWQPIAHFRKHLLPDLLEDVVGKLSGPARRWNMFILFLLCGALLQALIPPNTIDELSYHLVIPQLWEFQHHWWMSTDNYHLLFPSNVEIIWGYALGIQGLHLPRLITLIFGIMAIGGIRKWLKDLQFDPWIRGISLSFLVMTPLAVVMLPINYVEWPMFFWIFLGWWASIQFVNTRDRSYIVLTAIAWGMSAGTKYSALPVICLLGIEWGVVLVRHFSLQKTLRALLALIIGVFVFSGPWFLRNYMVTGDPIYPLGQMLPFQLSHSVSTDSQNVNHLTRYENLTGFWQWNQWLYYATVSRASDNRIHLGWPLLHWVVILFGWKFWRRGKPWGTVLILSIILFYFSPSPRIFFPLMGLTWFFLPDFLKMFHQRRSFRIGVSSLMLLFAIPSFAMTFYFWFMTYNRASQDYLMGLMNDNALLKKDGIITPVIEWVQGRTPLNARIWVWCDEQVFYFDRWVRPSSPYDIPVFLRIVETQGTQGLSHELKKDHLDYIVINTSRCPIPLISVKTKKNTWLISDELREQIDLWMQQHLKLIFKDRRFRLYKVLS